MKRKILERINQMDESELMKIGKELNLNPTELKAALAQ
jgi:hypothetical protein